MSTPRPAIRLEQNSNKEINVIDPKSRVIYTDAIREVSQNRFPDIEKLCGYILTKNSPSCGLFRVKVYNEKNGIVGRDGRGVFAKIISEKYPLLPMEEAERLNDSGIKENFLLRVMAYHHWRSTAEPQPSKRHILEFYSQYKLVMMSHSPKHYQIIGRLLSNMKVKNVRVVADEFIELFLSGLSVIATRKNHTNTLMHIQGYFKRKFGSDDKQELTQLIAAYREGHIPLITPMTLIKHHLARHPNDYLMDQKYIDPYPGTLGLRSNI